jgi:hypothetical protein
MNNERENFGNRIEMIETMMPSSGITTQTDKMNENASLVKPH